MQLTVVCCLFGDVHDGSYPEVMDGCKQNYVQEVCGLTQCLFLAAQHGA
jgi:hypothetical protein